MSKIEKDTVFDSPRDIADEHAKNVLTGYGLSDNASLAEIEQVATALLSNPRTLIDGMQMVLGRRVDAKDLKDTPEESSMLPLVGLANNGKDRFGILLLQVHLERNNTKDQEANK